VFLVSSGKAALTVILKALCSLYPDCNEVIIPAFCCYSVPSAIVRAGCKVRLCDLDPDTLDYKYDQLEVFRSNYTRVNGFNKGNRIADRTKKTDDTHRTNCVGRLLAVVSVHLFGLAADVSRIKQIVADPAVSVIEDAAQAIGAEKEGRKLGTIGDVGFYSLGRGKAISAVEGGIIVTGSEDIAGAVEWVFSTLPGYGLIEKMKLIIMSTAQLVFQRPSFFWLPKLLPFLRVGDTIYDQDFKIRRLSNFQAGLCRRWKDKLHRFTAYRKKAAELWLSRTEHGRIRSYGSVNAIHPNFVRYPIRIPEISRWKRLLKESGREGLGIMLTYPKSVSEIPELREEFAGQKYPAADILARTLLTLPVHPLLSEHDKKKICYYLRTI
jgi:dTDP-4-amino-4,6-dideoxygalactose transaminase